MTHKVLHLSIALLTLAPSVHAAEMGKETGKQASKLSFATAAAPHKGKGQLKHRGSLLDIMRSEQPKAVGSAKDALADALRPETPPATPIRALPDEVEAAKDALVNGVATLCVSPERAQELERRAKATLETASAAVIQEQPTAQLTHQDLLFPEAPKTEAREEAPKFEELAEAADKSSATAAKALALVALASDELTAKEAPVESAPARSEAELPQIDQLLATADQNNPYVRWATLQQELAHINTQLEALQDPDAAQVEGTKTQTAFEQRREEVTREILALENAPTLYEAYTGVRRSTEPDQTEIDEAKERLQLHTNKMSPRTLWNIANKRNLSLPMPAAVLTSEQRKTAQQARNAAIETENKRLEEALKNTTPKIRKKTDIRWELFEPAEVLALRAQTIRPVEPTSAETEELHNRQEEGRNFRLKNGQLLRPANYGKNLRSTLSLAFAQRATGKKGALPELMALITGKPVQSEDAGQVFDVHRDTLAEMNTIPMNRIRASDKDTALKDYEQLQKLRDASKAERDRLKNALAEAQKTLTSLKNCPDETALENARKKVERLEVEQAAYNSKRDTLLERIHRTEKEQGLPNTQSWGKTLAAFNPWGKK